MLSIGNGQQRPVLAGPSIYPALNIKYSLDWITLLKSLEPTKWSHFLADHDRGLAVDLVVVPLGIAHLVEVPFGFLVKSSCASLQSSRARKFSWVLHPC